MRVLCFYGNNFKERGYQYRGLTNESWWKEDNFIMFRADKLDRTTWVQNIQINMHSRFQITYNFIPLTNL